MGWLMSSVPSSTPDLPFGSMDPLGLFCISPASPCLWWIQDTTLASLVPQTYLVAPEQRCVPLAELSLARRP